MTTKLLVGTKKGAFILESKDRKEWRMHDPILFGNIIYHMVPDPRDTDRILIATSTGHLGPTVFRSDDGGTSWTEADQPPAFDEKEKTVKFVFWLTPGHADEEGVWWAGTSPQGLFRSEDHGKTWEPFDPFNKHELIRSITEGNMGTPIGPLLHSINVDPRDKNKMILAMSSGGAFQTDDYGQSWSAFNKNVLADFLPDPYPETGHCVHNMQLHPGSPDVVYQQGHCGVYRINRATDDQWERIGDNIPEDIGDMGFPLILHPRDTQKAWVVPMDGSDVWPRTSVNGKPALYMTSDGGKSWIRQDRGFPQEHAWFTVLRHATAHDYKDQLGLYLGNKAGEIWASDDEGETWTCIHRNLPEVYSIEVLSE